MVSRRCLSCAGCPQPSWPLPIQLRPAAPRENKRRHATAHLLKSANFPEFTGLKLTPSLWQLSKQRSGDQLPAGPTPPSH